MIELLTVIAIIGILAAILIPVVATVRHSARSSQSISNLRQIGMALSLATTERNDRFPFLNENVAGEAVFWPEILEDIVFDWDRYERGTGPRGRKHEIFDDPTMRREINHPISDYGANIYVMLDNNPNNPNRAEGGGLPLSAVLDPSRIITVCTAHATTNNRASWYIQGEFVRGGSPANIPHARLGAGMIGAVFVDGHVESIPPDVIFNDQTARRRLFDPDYRQ